MVGAAYQFSKTFDFYFNNQELAGLKDYMSETYPDVSDFHFVGCI